MKTRGFPRFLRGAIIFLAVSILISVPMALIRMSTPGPDFKGSPSEYDGNRGVPPQFPSRRNFAENFFKQYRASGYFEFTPALWANPIVHLFTGWEVLLPDVCLEATASGAPWFAGDGDINMRIEVSGKFEYLAKRLGVAGDSMRTKVLLEIDPPITKNFPIMHDIKAGDRLHICGRWVRDIGHGITEIHPPRWIEILETK